MAVNVLIPQTVYLESPYERLLAADIFRKGDSIYFFVISQYPDSSLDINKIRITGAEGLSLYGRPVGGSDSDLVTPGAVKYGSMLLVFDLPPGCTPGPMNIYADDVYYGRFTPKDFGFQTKSRLTAATLFLGDFETMRAWVEYHALLGFDRFVLYYNGFLHDIMARVSEIPSLAGFDILFVQWPYSYWLEGAPPGHPPASFHHAQILMLSHALIYLRDVTDYVAFFDLDEYFEIHGERSVLGFVERHQKDGYIFQSRWAETAANMPSLRDGAEYFQAVKVSVARQCVEFPHRTKYIGRPERIISTSAHYPFRTTPGTVLVRIDPAIGSLYHFHAFTNNPVRGDIGVSPGDWVGSDKLAETVRSR